MMKKIITSSFDMYILGISCYFHDSAAALIKDGKIIAAAEEERFSRKKHDNSFPQKAIEFCLSEAGISADDLDCVAFYEKPLLKFERVLYQHLSSFPFSAKEFVNAMPFWLSDKLKIKKVVKKQLGYKQDLVFVEHHMSHAASAFYPCPYEHAAIATVDGVGEWSSTAWGVGDGNKIELKQNISFPHSLGLLYSTVTAFLGFAVNNDEYKVMGLAAYGDPNVEYQQMKKLVDLKADGSYRLNMGYFDFIKGKQMPSKAMSELFNCPPRKSGEALTAKHQNIAAALQALYEECLFAILRHVKVSSGCDQLVLAGGCGLNSLANGKIAKMCGFTDVWIPPFPADNGGAVGAALYAYHQVFKKEQRVILKNTYLGPSYSREEVKKMLINGNFSFQELDDRALIEKIAVLIAESKIIGWFQGKMEFGPRALGNRSILANALNTGMKDLLNDKIKQRESFRPFAPVMCVEDVNEVFDVPAVPDATEFMTKVLPVKKAWHEKIPSVVHADGTGRLQVVSKNQNPLYYDLIKEFGKITGVPLLINTSFNHSSEPIVCTPQDALKSMKLCKLDYLVINNFIVRNE